MPTVRLLAMGHAARGLGTGDFQGELDTRVAPKLLPWVPRSGSVLSSKRSARCPVVPVVCPRALVGAGAAPWPTAPGDHCLWCLLLLVFAALLTLSAHGHPCRGTPRAESASPEARDSARPKSSVRPVRRSMAALTAWTRGCPCRTAATSGFSTGNGRTRGSQDHSAVCTASSTRPTRIPATPIQIRSGTQTRRAADTPFCTAVAATATIPRAPPAMARTTP